MIYLLLSVASQGHKGSIMMDNGKALPRRVKENNHPKPNATAVICWSVIGIWGTNSVEEGELSISICLSPSPRGESRAMYGYTCVLVIG